MERINLQAKAKELVSNASRTKVTITEEELMAAVKILSEPIIQDIKAQKKTMFCKKDELVALATQHITKNIDKDKYSCDYTLLPLAISCSISSSGILSTRQKESISKTSSWKMTCSLPRISSTTIIPVKSI